MDVAWPGRREDVLNALDLLAADPPQSLVDDRDVRWPGLTEAVHWLVDDTGWDMQAPNLSIGTMLRDEHEAAIIGEVVRAIVSVSERQGATASDAQWFADPAWAAVRALAAQAAAALRS